MNELERGTVAEYEHLDLYKHIKKHGLPQQDTFFKMIAKKHIKERPDYYTRLFKYVEKPQKNLRKLVDVSVTRNGKTTPWQVTQEEWRGPKLRKALQTIFKVSRLDYYKDKHGDIAVVYINGKLAGTVVAKKTRDL